MSDIILVRINCETKEADQTLSRLILESRLAACANISAPIQALYHWEGEIEQAEEFVLWLKTRAELWSDLEAFVKNQHGYETPAILALPVSAVNADYADWLIRETRTP